MKRFLVKAALALAFCAAGMDSALAQTKTTEPLTAEQQAELTKLKALAESLHPQFGDVTVGPADAALHLGRDYYFLPAAEAKRVLVEGWGNPTGGVTNVLGMVFPKGAGFWEDTWAAVVTYDPSGFVTDKDAQTADYDKLIRDVQGQEAEINENRKKAGVAAMHVVGWAQPPSYDKANHTLVWAQDIRFEGRSPDTLNYDVRVLGRHGVLSLNMVSEMPKLAEVRTAAQALRSTAGFNAGAAFADYKEGKDKAAGYGVAGLVAAGVGVAAAKKLGLLAIFLVFFKKAAVLIIAAGAAVVGWFRRRLPGKRKPPTAQAASALVGETPSVSETAAEGENAG